MQSLCTHCPSYGCSDSLWRIQGSLRRPEPCKLASFRTFSLSWTRLARPLVRIGFVWHVWASAPVGIGFVLHNWPPDAPFPRCPILPKFGFVLRISASAVAADEANWVCLARLASAGPRRQAVENVPSQVCAESASRNPKSAIDELGLFGTIGSDLGFGGPDDPSESEVLKLSPRGRQYVYYTIFGRRFQA